MMSSDFESWVLSNKPKWVHKPQYARIVYIAPQTKLTVREDHMQDRFCYASEVANDPQAEALNLYAIIEPHMTIAMEKALIEILKQSVQSWEDFRAEF